MAGRLFVAACLAAAAAGIQNIYPSANYTGCVPGLRRQGQQCRWRCLWARRLLLFAGTSLPPLHSCTRPCSFLSPSGSPYAARAFYQFMYDGACCSAFTVSATTPPQESGDVDLVIAYQPPGVAARGALVVRACVRRYRRRRRRRRLAASLVVHVAHGRLLHERQHRTHLPPLVAAGQQRVGR